MAETSNVDDLWVNSLRKIVTNTAEAVGAGAGGGATLVAEVQEVSDNQELLLDRQFARHGSDKVTSADGVVTGSWYGIIALVDTVINNLTSDSGLEPGDSLAQGITVFGNFTALVVTSGTLLAFKKSA